MQCIVSCRQNEEMPLSLGYGLGGVACPGGSYSTLSDCSYSHCRRPWYFHKRETDDDGQTIDGRFPFFALVAVDVDVVVVVVDDAGVFAVVTFCLSSLLNRKTFVAVRPDSFNASCK